MDIDGGKNMEDDEIINRFFGCDVCGNRKLKHVHDIETDSWHWVCLKCGHKMNDFTRSHL